MKKPSLRTTEYLAVPTALVAILLAVAILWVASVADAANAGKAQVQKGVALLASQDATGAATSFDAAARTFSRARGLLGPEWVGHAVAVIPPAGRQYAAARALVAIGLDGSHAGSAFAAALRKAPPSPVKGKPMAGLGSVLVTERPRVDAALAALADAADRAAPLSEAGLVPELAKAVHAVKSALSEAGPLLHRSHDLLSLDTFLLTSNRRILLVSQDGAELRPTGGFMGSYGVVDVGPAGVTLESYQDVYTLPAPRHRVPPPPGALMAGRAFTFHDANWWIDFPTSARAMLGFWKAARQAPVDGVVAVDPIAMKDLLGVLGPVRVASYSETFTADNLLTRLLQIVEVKRAGTSNRKGVLTALAEELERRLLAAGPQDLVKSAAALGKAADGRHVQAYFSDPSAEAALEGLGWSGRVATTPETTDLLAVCNAQNKGSKANLAMNKSITYLVALEPDGSADTTLVLGYSYTAPAKVPYNGIFRDYLRVYRAPGTILSPGSTPATVRSLVEFGLPAEVRTFGLARGQSRVETLTGKLLAGAWRPVAGGSSAHYRLLIVRQADLQDVPTKVTVTSPRGWRVSSVTARLTASGQVLTPTRDRAHARLALPLSGDVAFDVVLTRE